MVQKNRLTRSCGSSTTGYSRFLRQPVVRDGQWQLLECAPAWEGNWTNNCLVAFAGKEQVESVNRGGETMPPTRVRVASKLPFTDLCWQILVLARSGLFCALRARWN